MIKTRLIKYLNTNSFSEDKFASSVEDELNGWAIKKRDIISTVMISSDCLMVIYKEKDEKKD